MKVREPKAETIQRLTEDRKKFPAEDLSPLKKYPRTKDAKTRDAWIKHAVPYMRAFLAEGLSQDEIKERLGVTDYIYDRVEQYLFDTEATKVSNFGSSRHYYLYLLRMEYAARQLDRYIEKHMDDATGAGVVSAIKAKAGLYGDVIKMGQDLGIVSKRAKELRMYGNINLATLDTDELQELMLSKMKSFADLVSPKAALPDAYNTMLKNALTREVKRDEEYIDVEYETAPDEA